MKECNIEWVMVDHIMVSFATAGPISQASYERWMKDFDSTPVTKYLATAWGMTDLSSVQRKGVADLLKRRSIQVAVVTDQQLVRGIVTALSWLGVNIKGFDWPELRDALRHLRADPASDDRIVSVLSRLRSVAETQKK